MASDGCCLRFYLAGFSWPKKPKYLPMEAIKSPDGDKKAKILSKTRNTLQGFDGFVFNNGRVKLLFLIKKTTNGRAEG